MTVFGEKMLCFSGWRCVKFFVMWFFNWLTFEFKLNSKSIRDGTRLWISNALSLAHCVVIGESNGGDISLSTVTYLSPLFYTIDTDHIYRFILIFIVIITLWFLVYSTHINRNVSMPELVLLTTIEAIFSQRKQYSDVFSSSS